MTKRRDTRTEALVRALRESVRAGAQNRPGVYRMLGPDGQLIYVGKSVQVRGRLMSYFRADRGEKAADIIGSTQRIEWDYVPSEFASLLLEMALIRRHRPPYNWEHKHERAYCFIKLTREAAPRLLPVNYASDDRSLYYGPYTGRQHVREALRELCDVMQLRDCGSHVPIRFADQTELFAHEETPRCIRADLKRCLGPCAARCNEHQYLEHVQIARRFLDGDVDRPLVLMQERMQQAAQRTNFEYAAELRDRAQRLRDVRDGLLALRSSLANLSFMYRVPGFAGDDRIYMVRAGSIRAEVAAPRTPAEGARLAARAREVYTGPDPLRMGVPPHKVAEILLIARWFRLRPEERERTFAPHTLYA
jgi:excinuclease ABC subunit C